MNKDASVDRLLERTSRARADTRPEGACLGAEILAAWADGSLTETERTAAETHAADCDRCLAVLAAIAKTAPPPSVSERPWWLALRWLVPLTTAAVAITAWAIVEGPEKARLQAPPPPSAAVQDAGKPAEPPVQAERDASPQARGQAVEKPARSIEKKEVGQSSTPSKADDETRRVAGKLEKDGLVPPRSSAPVPPSAAAVPPPAAAAPVPPPPPAATPPSATAATPQGLPRSRSEAVDTSARFGVLADGSRQAPRVIISPDQDQRWRTVGTSVERSIDGGRSWRAQQTGTAVDLLAGSSPAPNVCWIVGRSGVVLLSTDGETWRRLDFPVTQVDLMAVTALDGLAATVTAADGRTYRTTDAGRTWTLQENPATPF